MIQDCDAASRDNTLEDKCEGGVQTDSFLNTSIEIREVADFVPFRVGEGEIRCYEFTG